MVTLEEIKQHLKIDHSDDDTLLQSYLSAAIDETEKRLGKALSEFEVLPASLKIALLVKVGEFYDVDRNGSALTATRETGLYEKLIRVNLYR